MSTIRNKMVQELELAGYALKTRKRYLECVGISRGSAGHRRRRTKRKVRAWVALQKNKIGPQPKQLKLTATLAGARDVRSLTADR